MISHVTAYTGTDENPGDYRAFRLRDYKLLPDSTGYLSEIIETVYSAYSGLKKLDLNKLPRLGFSINLPIDFFIEFRYEVTYKDGTVVETLTYREGIEEDEEVLSYNKEDGLKLLTENPDIVIDFLTDDLYDLVNTDLDLVIPRIMPKVFDGMVNIKRVEISKKEEVRKGILSRIIYTVTLHKYIGRVNNFKINNFLFLRHTINLKFILPHIRNYTIDGCKIVNLSPNP